MLIAILLGFVKPGSVVSVMAVAVNESLCWSTLKG